MTPKTTQQATASSNLTSASDAKNPLPLEPIPLDAKRIPSAGDLLVRHHRTRRRQVAFGGITALAAIAGILVLPTRPDTLPPATLPQQITVTQLETPVVNQTQASITTDATEPPGLWFADFSADASSALIYFQANENSLPIAVGQWTAPIEIDMPLWQLNEDLQREIRTEWAAYGEPNTIEL